MRMFNDFDFKETFFLNSKQFVLDSVYVPSDDSFLLMNSVEVVKDSVVLDLGCGSGIQGLNALKKAAKRVVFSDVNFKALVSARKNVFNAGFIDSSEFVESDLFSNISQKFDLIIFNPPYVVTDDLRFVELDGGRNGRFLLDKFLNEFDLFLKKNGVVFFLQTDLNDLVKTKKILLSKGFLFEVIARKKLFFEELFVFKVFRK